MLETAQFIFGMFLKHVLGFPGAKHNTRDDSGQEC